MSCITMTNSGGNSFSTLFSRLSGSTYLDNVMLFSENLTASTVARSSGRTWTFSFRCYTGCVKKTEQI
jgi:hypothetical protein